MKIPDHVQNCLLKLEENSFEAFVVGGCVRDLLMEKTPKDWDITTNARPEQIMEVFTEGKYENNFGTVLVPIKNEEGETLDVVEITTYRSEQGYSDRRHPDEVRFEDDIEEDLKRRDFTVNAMAAKNSNDKFQTRLPDGQVPNKISNFKFQISNLEVIDLFGGREDLKKKIIRAVGEPVDRFKEDALRMLRAVRFSCQLGFEIEPKTERGISKMAGAIKFISQERIRDELVKIFESDKPYDGIMKLHELKLLQYILPELESGIGIGQNRHHIYTVFEHSVYSLKNCPSKDWRVRLAALLHDVAKPQTKKIINGEGTFYNHDIVGAKMVGRITKRLKFSNEDAEKIILLVRYHMFYYNVDEVTESSVRRLISKVGKENLRDLIDMRIADRLGSGVPKAKPYKLRHLEYMFEKVQNDPVSVKMLKIDGNEIMGSLKIEPGPKVGAILDVLLSEVIEDPSLNNKEYLEKRSRELDEFDLKKLREQAKEKIEGKRQDDDEKIKKGHWVK